MAKYQRYEKEPVSAKNRIHPVWRGIGCLLMVIIPILSFITSIELANGSLRGLIPIPYNYLRDVQFPDWIQKIPLLSDAVRFITGYPNFLSVVVIGILITVILGAIFSTAYSFLYRVIGPPRYTYLDAPPPKRPRGMKKSR